MRKSGAQRESYKKKGPTISLLGGSRNAFILIIWNFGIEHSIINVKIYEKIYFMVEKMTFEKNVLSP